MGFTDGGCVYLKPWQLLLIDAQMFTVQIRKCRSTAGDWALVGWPYYGHDELVDVLQNDDGSHDYIVLFRCLHSRNYRYPPAATWTAIHESVTGTCPRIEYSEFKTPGA